MSIDKKMAAAIRAVIELEGGYSNIPADSGGETNYGITERVARRYGYSGAMREMPYEFAHRVYERRYWNRLSLSAVDRIAPLITIELFDTAVNLGPGRAAEFLQRILNVMNDREKLYRNIAVDGDIGPATCQALGQFINHRGLIGEQVLLTALKSLQGAFYIELAERRQKDEAFVFGWLKNRV